jgi:hypothetical protein
MTTRSARASTRPICSFIAAARRDSAGLAGYTNSSNAAFEQIGLVEARAGIGIGLGGHGGRREGKGQDHRCAWTNRLVVRRPARGTPANRDAFIAAARRDSAGLAGYTNSSNAAFEQIVVAPGRTGWW